MAPKGSDPSFQSKDKAAVSTIYSTNNAKENLEKVETSDSVPLYKIVLTGGPCGGKTTALARLSNYLRERGFEVMTCPEAYSLLITNGMPTTDHENQAEDMQIQVQHSVMDLMISIEDSFARVLRAKGRPGVLLCDRGIMDGSAYLSSEEWNKILSSRGITNSVELREGRYDAVYHLVTAAEGAEEYYTLENNVARTETPEDARFVDSLTRNAWLGHSNLRVFDNSIDFEGKMQRLVQATAKLVGLPSEVDRRATKFLLNGEPTLTDFPEGVRYHIFDVEKVYLHARDFHNDENSMYETEYSYIRRRSLRDSEGAAFGHTTVQKTKDGHNIELKRIITEREYYGLLKYRDMSRNVIKQTRVSFVWEMQSLNIHTYIEPVQDLCILHCQSDPSEEIRFPPFLDVERKLECAEDKRRFGSLRLSQTDLSGIN